MHAKKARHSELPDEDRREILRETRAHFADRMADGDPETVVAETVEEFGPPEDYARHFLENYQITAAVADGSGMRMVPQALRVAGRSIAGFLGSAGVLLVYGVALALLVLALLKPVFPTHVGLWYNPGAGVAGLGYVDAETIQAGNELLGYGLIPVCIVGALLLYRTATSLLRRFLRTFIRLD